MKMRIYWYSLTLAGLVLPLTGGCLQDTVSPAASATPAVTSALVPVPDDLTNKVADSNAPAQTPPPAPATATAPASTNTPAALNPEDADEDADDIVKAEARPVSFQREVPPLAQTNAALMEIVKLADAGVEEAVMLAYVTNSPAGFNLSADQIIYLNDIGVPETVVTAMLRHDQNLRWTGSAPVTNLTTVWSTPEETNTPQTELAPADMAPQSTAPPPPADGAQAAPAAPPSQVTYNTFYSSLAPYGTWVEVDGYGRCWQPSVVVVNPGWQPYLDSGRWIYTDAGWYWYSYYSWGWAPFHYGRWFQHYRLGWCWYPDVYWGPSWVTWRYSSGYCGWAPLPPSACYYPGIGITYWGSSVSVSFGFGLHAHHYAYVPWNHFHHHHPGRYAVPHGNRDRIHQDTVVATRIEGNRNAVNRGLPVEKVAMATKTKIQPIPIRDSRTPPLASRARPERISADGKSLAVYRPEMPDKPRELPAAIQRQRAGAGDSSQFAGTRTPPARVDAGGRKVEPAQVTRAERDARTPATASNLDRRQPVTMERPVSARNLNRPTPTVTRPTDTAANPAGGQVNDRNQGTRRVDPARPATSLPQTQGRTEVSRTDTIGARRPGASVPANSGQVQPDRSARTPTVPAQRSPDVSRQPQRPTAPSSDSRSVPQTLPTRTFENPRGTTAAPQSNPRTVPQSAAPQVGTSQRSLPQAGQRSASPFTPAAAMNAPSASRSVEVPRYTPSPSVAPQQQFQRSAPAASPAYTPPQRSVAPSSQPSFRGSDSGGFSRSAPSAPSAIQAPSAPTRSFSAPSGGGFSRPSSPQSGGGNGRSSGDRPGR